MAPTSGLPSLLTALVAHDCARAEPVEKEITSSARAKRFMASLPGFRTTSAYRVKLTFWRGEGLIEFRFWVNGIPAGDVKRRDFKEGPLAAAAIARSGPERRETKSGFT